MDMNKSSSCRVSSVALRLLAFEPECSKSINKSYLLQYPSACNVCGYSHTSCKHKRRSWNQDCRIIKTSMPPPIGILRNYCTLFIILPTL